MTLKKTITPKENATQKIIAENNFSTPQSEIVFQFLISRYKKRTNQTADEAINFIVVSTIENTINQTVEFETDFTETKIDAHREKWITRLINHYENIVSNQIFYYFQAFPEIASVSSEIKVADANIVSELVFPNHFSIYPSNDVGIFNCENAGPVDRWVNLTTEETAETRPSIHDSVLKELDYLDFLVNCQEEPDERVGIGDLLTAFARYQLYHHASLHRLYYNKFQILVKTFSDLYSINLQSRFVRCSCCNEISRDRNEVFSKVDE